MAVPEESVGFRRRKPSRLALQLADAFATLDEWSEVKVVRNEFGRRNRVVAQIPTAGSRPYPYDWSAAA